MNRLPARAEIQNDTPLRLDVAAAVYFPKGTMTASGLRREAKAGRLMIYRIAGRDFTTLADIANMQAACRDPYGLHDSTCVAVTTVAPTGLSSTVDAKSAQERLKLIAEELKRRSRATSGSSTAPDSATVIPLVSR